MSKKKTSVPSTPGPRGFAAMPLERRREIASAGGKKAHALGRAPEFDSDSAREASLKGHQMRRKAEEVEFEKRQLRLPGT